MTSQHPFLFPTWVYFPLALFAPQDCTGAIVTVFPNRDMPMENENHENAVSSFSDKPFSNFDGVLMKFEQAKIFARYLKAARQGDASSQLFLGCCYAKGEGTRQNYAKAVRWLRKAAEQGDARAQLKLGICCTRGLSTTLGCEEAAAWFLLAAQQGLAEAQNNLGVLYMTGQGVHRNYKTGLRWLRAAAGKGLLRAVCNLFLCYSKGIGVRQDDDETFRWTRKALEVAKKDRPKLKELIAHRRSGNFSP